MEEQKRIKARIASLNLVSIEHFDDNQITDLLTVGRTLDLTEGGIKLEAAQALPLKSKLSLTLALKDRLIDVRAEVVYLAVVQEDKIHMGMKFLDPGEERQQLIREFLSPDAD